MSTLRRRFPARALYKTSVVFFKLEVGYVDYHCVCDWGSGWHGGE
jgi:hypothetical protein